MRVLDKKDAWPFILECVKLAKRSSCYRARCGSIVVSEGDIIGCGFNGPPLGEVLSECRKDALPSDFKGERACCVHAEQRAIMDALARNPGKLQGSSLYFSREASGEPIPSGKPWCTICSKMALDAGLSEFVLWHESGITAYDTREYNSLSYAYRRP